MILVLFALIVNAQQTTDTASQSTNRGKVFTAVEINATFSGPGTFFQFIANNIRYPANAFLHHIQGKVFVQFTVKTNGEVGDAVILRSASPELDTEALRVVRLSRWYPGIQNGKAVVARFTVPITFNIMSPAPIHNTPESKPITDSLAKTIHQIASDKDALNQSATTAPSNIVPKTDYETVIFTAVEIEPQFPGGLAKFKKYVNTNKQSDETGRVIAQFVVERDGSLSNIKVLRSTSDVLGAEATRLLLNSPKWTPGMQNGHVVRCYYTSGLDF